MKRTMIVVVLCVLMVIAPTQKSQAVFWVAAKAAIKKAMKAVDLQIQRQQNKVIWLQNAQKTVENAMSKTRLNEISDWTRKQRDQYKKYYEELQKVKAIISYYQRVKSIGKKQSDLFKAYQRTWSLIKKDKHFTPEEVQYMGKVYGGILDESVENLDQIILVINSFKTQMSDAKRMEIIDLAAVRIDENYTDLLTFNNQAALLSLNRSKTQMEVQSVKSFYGLK